MIKSFQGRVRGLSSKGLGVVEHPEGKVYFVPGCYPGEEGLFEITKERKTHGLAQVAELTKTADFRTAARCQHQDQCGNCPWMGIDYHQQLAFKLQRLKDALSKQQLPISKVQPIIPSPLIYGYRNRARLRTDGEQLGYFSASSQDFVPIKDCPILTEKNRALLAGIQKRLGKHKSDLGFFEIDEKIQDIEKIEMNKRRPFIQANTDQNNFMKNWILEKIKQYPQDWKVLELFAGSGNFTQVLAKHFTETIVAIDSSGKNVHAEKFEFIRANLFAPKTFEQLKEKDFEVLLLDPPRTGFKLLPLLLQLLPKLQQIIFASCNPETFAREAKVLARQGWLMETLQPLDQFPHTPHVEILSSWKKPKEI